MTEAAGEWSRGKRQIAVASATAIEETTRLTGSLFSGGPDGEDRPAVILIVQRNVKLAILVLAGVLNRPRPRDVILPLGAHLAGSLLLEAARMHFSEKAIEQMESSARGFASLIAQPTENFQIGVGEALLFSNGDRLMKEFLTDGGILGKLNRMEGETPSESESEEDDPPAVPAPARRNTGRGSLAFSRSRMTTLS